MSAPSRTTFTLALPERQRAEYEALYDSPPPANILAIIKRLCDTRPDVLTPAHRSALRECFQKPWLARFVYDQYVHDPVLLDLLQQTYFQKLERREVGLATLFFIFGDDSAFLFLKRNQRTKARVTAR